MRFRTNDADEISIADYLHAWEFCNSRCVDGGELGIEGGWAEDASMQHAGALDVRRVGVVACDHVPAVHLGDGFAARFAYRACAYFLD